MPIGTIAAFGAKYVLPTVASFIAGRGTKNVAQSARPNIPEFISPANIPETTGNALRDLIATKRSVGIQSIQQQVGQAKRGKGLNLAASGLSQSTAPGIRGQAFGGIERSGFQATAQLEAQLAELDFTSRQRISDAMNEFNLATAQLEFTGDLNAQRRVDSAIAAIADVLGMAGAIALLGGGGDVGAMSQFAKIGAQTAGTQGAQSVGSIQSFLGR